ncbi:MAG TPA: hypothetical protein VGN97_20260 [Mesorhizobium sp.]|jgi:hypothetical protein|nr:hypothetical protein [Mesorhizobium sp.]
MNLNPRTGALSGAFLLSSTLLLLPTAPAQAQQSLRPVLSAAQCQPLSEANFEMCCVAQNRAQFLTPEEVRSCPPLTTALVARVVEALQGEDDDLQRDGRNAGRAANPAAANPDAVDNTATSGVTGNNGQATGTAAAGGSAAAGGTASQGTAGAPSGGTGAKDGKNNNGLGNGGEPSAGEPEGEKGQDPSNPGQGGGKSKGGGGNGNAGGNKGGKGGNK